MTMKMFTTNIEHVQKFFYKGRFSKISGISSGFYFVFHEKISKISKKDVIRAGSIFQHIFKRCFSSTNTRTLVALIRNYYWFRTFLVLSFVFRFQTFDQLPIKIHKNIKNNMLLSFLRCTMKNSKMEYKSEMFILMRKWSKLGHF